MLIPIAITEQAIKTGQIEYKSEKDSYSLVVLKASEIFEFFTIFIVDSPLGKQILPQ